jgi:DNA-binding beta-propeller fold protein YncE
LITVTVITANGTTYFLKQNLTTTIRSVKQNLATQSDMSVGHQSMFLIDDDREGDVLELKNHLLLNEVRKYALVTSVEELHFAVMVGIGSVSAVEFIHDFSPSPQPTKIGDGSCGQADHQLDNARGAAFVPGYPELVVVAVASHSDLRVYNWQSKTLLCKIGGEGELFSPLGVAVTADSLHIVVTEQMGGRVRLLRLQVAVDANGGVSTASLIFMRIITGGLNFPWGVSLAQRPLADNAMHETVLVAENGNDRVLEYELDGTLIRTYGTGRRSKEDGDMHFAADVAYLPQSNEVAVAEQGNHRISIFDGASGAFVRHFGIEGKEADGEFSEPTAITSDASGNLLVMDENTDRLQAFNGMGEHLCTWNHLGIEEHSRKGIAWSADVGVAIANGTGNTVCVFDTASTEEPGCTKAQPPRPA